MVLSILSAACNSMLSRCVDIKTCGRSKRTFHLPIVHLKYVGSSFASEGCDYQIVQFSF